MKKIWTYLSIFLLGILGGILAWEKIDYKTVYKGRFKVKQSGKGNVLDSDLTLQVGKKSTKSERKMDRIRSRVENRKQRALKRLDKLS